MLSSQKDDPSGASETPVLALAPTRPPGRSAQITHWLLLASLGWSVLHLIQAPIILAAAGGRVGHYLFAALLAIPPLGWGRNPAIKIIALVVVLTSLCLASRDHNAGVLYQQRLANIKVMAATRSAISPTSQPTTAASSGPTAE